MFYTGWTNHPGRPKLLYSKAESDGFELLFELFHPNYLAGVDRNFLAYDIYFGRAKTLGSRDYIKNIRATNTSDTIITNYSLTSTVRITELEELAHYYFMSVQLVIVNKKLSGLAALPRSSPILQLNPYCDHVG